MEACYQVRSARFAYLLSSLETMDLTSSRRTPEYHDTLLINNSLRSLLPNPLVLDDRLMYKFTEDARETLQGSPATYNTISQKSEKCHLWKEKPKQRNDNEGKRNERRCGEVHGR